MNRLHYFLPLLAAGMLFTTGIHSPSAYGNENTPGYSSQTLPPDGKSSHRRQKPVQIGVRPYHLVDDMDPGPLKRKLKRCGVKKFRKSKFSIGHRGAPLQFPEHTKESYKAAARQGAGIIECDVTFTKDRELVCRHAQCDLHTTTDILLRPDLASSCRVPFEPADPENGIAAKAECCTSDITLAEFKTLCGKMDASLPTATTVEDYVNGGTADWRTDLYSSCATVLSHAESIRLINRLGADFTPELKSPQVDMPFDRDYTQQDYAQQMIDEYREARIRPRRVWAQSFNLDDVRYWIENAPRFGKQAVYLDDRVYRDPNFEPTLENMEALFAEGVRVIAPPMFALLEVDSFGEVVPSEYALLAQQAGLDIIAWTLERSGRLRDGGGFYYQSIEEVTDNDGDVMVALDVLARDVGVLGVFSDWPATTTFYANCTGL